MTYAPPPVVCNWDGDAFVPQPRFARVCDKAFTIGEDYPLVVHENVSAATRGHYFACLAECWRNLPEDVAERFPSVEHLRKFALIKSGYADERSIVCASKAEAQRVAAFVRPMDEYAVIVVSESVVKVFTAQSQSQRAMGKATFQASKDAVLAYAASLIGVAPQTVAANAGKAA
jgi:hypothetical protein